MKTLFWNIFWLIAMAAVAYAVIHRLEVASDRCLIEVTKIEKILNTWELSN